MAEGILVLTGHPRGARDGPAFAAQGLLPAAGPLAVEAVDVEVPVEVVVLVLHDAGKPAGGLEVDRVALHVEALKPDMVRTLQREAVAGSREAALRLRLLVGFLLRDLAQQCQHRVDHVAGVGHRTGVPEGPGEDAQTHTDLRGSQPYAACRHLGLVHVLDQGADLVIDHLDVGCAAVQDRLTVDGDGTDGHAGHSWIGGDRCTAPGQGAPMHRMILVRSGAQEPRCLTLRPS